MRRREEKLGLRFADAVRGRFGTKLLERLRSRPFACDVREWSPRFDGGIIRSDLPLPCGITVHDGLPALTDKAKVPGAAADLFEKDRCGVFEAELLECAAAVGEVTLPHVHKARVRSCDLLSLPRIRFFGMQRIAGFVHRAALIRNRLPEARDGDKFLVARPSVREWTAGAIELPHMITGLDAECLPDEVRQSFLREAEIINRIPAGQSELLAVFYHVPIEMLSYVRFLADNRMLLYRISPGLRRTQTRVHDMAAVRNTTDNTIHLIPHRGRFRTLSLRELRPSHE